MMLHNLYYCAGLTHSSFVFPAAARVLLCVRVVCLRGVFAARASSSMKRGKKAEEEAAAAEGENDAGSGADINLVLPCFALNGFLVCV